MYICIYMAWNLTLSVSQRMYRSQPYLPLCGIASAAALLAVTCAVLLDAAYWLSQFMLATKTNVHIYISLRDLLKAP